MPNCFNNVTHSSTLFYPVHARDWYTLQIVLSADSATTMYVLHCYMHIYANSRRRPFSGYPNISNFKHSSQPNTTYAHKETWHNMAHHSTIPLFIIHAMPSKTGPWDSDHEARRHEVTECYSERSKSRGHWLISIYCKWINHKAWLKQVTLNQSTKYGHVF